MQKQLEKKILEVEKIKEAEQEQRRNAINDLEKQVSEPEIYAIKPLRNPSHFFNMFMKLHVK